ncbi:hypothetical protein CNMCM5623_009910 [Aspergillus felis]|uniref:WSC domain-containing protein n=1 Tax=Aspergillus felis TaxID=1287682 RepID=A0A8H6Q4J4_9EURO|nr:hypothetical protein CNMCM5623_009910 [Aspergillus felis]KAF7181655.1 hypothetical protein CNMCM7691_000952 [Aspergillus felis]
MKPFTIRSAVTAAALLLTTNLPAAFAADMSNGYCQQQCLKSNNLVFALTKGTNCLCGNVLPAKSAKTDDSDCNVKCAGWPDVMCGGQASFSVYLTGLSSKVPYYSDDSSASTNPSSTSTTNGGSTVTTGSHGQVVTQGEQTVVVTAAANEAGATNGLNQQKNSGGPNTAAIAAGVVVGVVGFCSLVGAGFFLWRFRKRANVQPQYSNNAAAEHFGKPVSQDSMSDSRFDGDFMAKRRQSNGSIDDDQDFSRRILQVTNPDRR